MESKPGLYRNVLVFDFKSLYPSIIRTFNIDPLTHVPPRARRDRRRPDRAPNGAASGATSRHHPGAARARSATEREQAKRAGNAVKANAIKILMNSFYGVLGAGASRLFSPAVANAVTSLRPAADPHRRRRARAAHGYEVIYGDTDSLFVYPGEPDAARAAGARRRLRADDRRGGRRAHPRRVRLRQRPGARVREALPALLPARSARRQGREQEALRRAAVDETGASTSSSSASSRCGATGAR